MLKRTNRLRKRSDFDLLRNKGEFWGGNLFGVSFLEEGEEGNRFGFIISKKISKKAVDRNKIKRWLSEAVKKKLGNFEGKNLKMIFLVKRTILEKKQEEVEKEVEKFIKLIK